MNTIEKVFREYPLAREIYKGILNRIFSLFDFNNGVKIMEENWKNLIILDACRYDYFKQINWIKGELKKKISLGSHTKIWKEKNFTGDYPDVIYISATPQVSKKRLGRNPFFKIENVWDYGWDKSIETVPPKEVSKAAFKLYKKHPDKRLVIHYLQPHRPYPLTPEVSRPKISSLNRYSPRKDILWSILKTLLKILGGAEGLEKRAKRGKNEWDYLREGQIELKHVKEGYVDNLIWVLREVNKLLKKIEGKTIITSDHGNLFGEHFLYGHPPKLHFKELLEIPWLKVKK